MLVPLFFVPLVDAINHKGHLKQPVVNFINILAHSFCMKVLCTAFPYLQFGFVTFWQKYIGRKSARKMLMKLTPTLTKCKSTNMLRIAENVPLCFTIAPFTVLQFIHLSTKILLTVVETRGQLHIFGLLTFPCFLLRNLCSCRFYEN